MTDIIYVFDEECSIKRTQVAGDDRKIYLDIHIEAHYIYINVQKGRSL